MLEQKISKVTSWLELIDEKPTYWCIYKNVKKKKKIFRSQILTTNASEVNGQTFLIVSSEKLMFC